MKTKPTLLLLLLMMLLPQLLHAYAEGDRYENVKFARGSSSTTIRSSIQGYQTAYYTIDARAGQNMTVSMKTTNGANYFNIFAPGRGPGDQALFQGEINNNRYKGVLPRTGRYTVQVYLMRSAARRNERANYTLNIGITGSGGSSMAPAPGQGLNWPTNYDASGPLVCSARDGSGKQNCQFRVKRVDYGRGGATIWVTKPSSRSLRVLYFKNTRFTTNENVSVIQERVGDSWRVMVGQDEMYYIPDAVIFGG